MVTRTGRVQAIDEIVVSPLLSEPCVFYAVEVTDVATQRVIASERHGVRFVVAATDGRRIALSPKSAIVEGFVAFDTRCRVRDASPRVSAFLAGKGLLGMPDRHLRVVERHIEVGDLVSASGMLSTPSVGEAEPYRSQPRTTEETFEPAGLVVFDTVRRQKTVRTQWLVVGAVGALLGFVLLPHVGRPDGYRGQEDCPWGTTYQPYYQSTGDDWCGNPQVMARMRISSEHHVDTDRGNGACVGHGVTYWGPEQEPWTLRLTGR